MMIRKRHLKRAGFGQLVSRLEVLEGVALRIGSSLDTDQIVTSVAEETLRVVDYHHFRLYRWDEGQQCLLLTKSVARIPPYNAVDWEGRALRIAPGDGVTGQCAITRASVLVPDASGDPRMLYVDGAQRLLESVICAPMVAGTRLLGVLSLARLGAHSLTRDDERLMQSIAAQTGLALANAERYAAAEQTIRALAAIEAVGAADEAGGAALPTRIAEAFADLAQADFVTVRVRDQQDRRFYLGGTAGTPQELPPMPPLDDRDVRWLVEAGQGAVTLDAQTDGRVPAWAQRIARTAGSRTSIYLPLRDGAEFVGFIGVHWRQPRWVGTDQISRLSLVAAQAALTIATREALRLERQRAASLAELERSRREFMQIASHELRTPLTVIRGYASLLEEGSLGPLPERARAALRVLIDKTAGMRAEIERMLFLGRLEEGRAFYQMRDLDLRTVVEEAVGRVQAELALRGGRLTARLGTQRVPIVGDPERLALVFDNLLQNAVKFSVEAPAIEVELAARDGSAEVQVRDHGIGIDPVALDRLFEKFYRVDNPQLRNVAGTGIGLYLVRQVVEGHGGAVEAWSEPSRGTRFTVRLPTAVPLPEQEPAHSGVAPSDGYR
jgi:signal transduction histidine kinase